VADHKPVSLSEQQIYVNGNLAWEIGQESGTPKMKDGKDAPADYIITNVYEKIDSQWLIVSHHVQPSLNNQIRSSMFSGAPRLVQLSGLLMSMPNITL
jgi:ketosteroid isomerase-like protein